MVKDNPLNKDINLSVNLDSTPILYTDSVYMTANEDGVVLDVVQKIGPTNQQRIVARIGMSLQHAKKLATMLAKIVVNPGATQRTDKKIIN